jgi:maltose alpha-D-glucosyltransferase/alpha-amylase
LVEQATAEDDGAPPNPRSERLFLPLAIQWQEHEGTLPTVPSAATTLAAVRRQATRGQLFDAFVDAGFVQALARAVGAAASIPIGRGRLDLKPTAAFDALAGKDLDASVRLLPADADNGVVLGDRLVLRTLRCPLADGHAAAAEPPANAPSETTPGPSSAVESPFEPMVELALHLTGGIGRAKLPALAGHLDYTDPLGRRCTLAMLEQYVPNQGDLGCRTAELLRRLCDEYFSARADDTWHDDPAQISFDVLVERLGVALAELHLALVAVPVDAFRPEPIGAAETAGFRHELHRRVTHTLSRLARRRQTLTGAEQRLADALLAQREDIEQLGSALSAADLGPLRCRVHGDLSLERVLVAESELVLTGAGGPPGRPPHERRRKQPPLSDLGRLLCSLHERVACVEQAMASEHPDQSDRLAKSIRAWRRMIAGRLLGAYTTASAGSALLPDSGEAEGRRGIQLFALSAAFESLADALSWRAERIGGALGALLSLLAEASRREGP